MSEINRRVQLGIFDPEEFKKAMEWTAKYCKPNEGEDTNDDDKKKSRAKLDEEWEFVVKMTMIMRDLMIGNPKIGRTRFRRRSIGS